MRRELIAVAVGMTALAGLSGCGHPPLSGTPAQAAVYINMVRARPGVNMTPVAPATKNAALRAVMHERSVELAGEGGNNIDILRWRKKGYFPSIMADPKQGQVDMLPIPFAETSTNPLIQ